MDTMVFDAVTSPYLGVVLGFQTKIVQKFIARGTETLTGVTEFAKCRGQILKSGDFYMIPGPSRLSDIFEALRAAARSPGAATRRTEQLLNPRIWILIHATGAKPDLRCCQRLQITFKWLG